MKRREGKNIWFALIKFYTKPSMNWNDLLGKILTFDKDNPAVEALVVVLCKVRHS